MRAVARPNFLVIGAAKCGTTALYHYLRQHPDIYMSDNKEPLFLAYDFDDPDFSDKQRGGVATLEEYEALFDGVTTERAVGEASTLYVYSPLTIPNIKRYVPDAKLIALVRNPADRAFSSFQQIVAMGTEPLTDFAEALAAEPQRLATRTTLTHYRNGGYYYRQLKPYYDEFGSDRIRVYLHEDLTAEPLAVLQDIFRFLGVDDTYAPDFSVRHNVAIARAPRNPVAGFLRKPSVIRPIRKLVPAPIRHGLVPVLYTGSAFPVEIRRQLIEDFREDILQLESLIGRDLSAWLEVPEGDTPTASPRTSARYANARS
jgi:hypothetical protein